MTEQKVIYFTNSSPDERREMENDLNALIKDGWTVKQIALGQHKDRSYGYAIVEKESKPTAGIQ